MMSNVASLDYEAKPHHQLRVRATDTLNGGYSEAIVLFEVEDVRVLAISYPLLYLSAKRKPFSIGERLSTRV